MNIENSKNIDVPPSGQNDNPDFDHAIDTTAEDLAADAAIVMSCADVATALADPSRDDSW